MALTYDATISLGQDGDLRLHGYVGLPLFGETQRWSPFTGRTFADCRLPGNNPNGERDAAAFKKHAKTYFALAYYKNRPVS